MTISLIGVLLLVIGLFLFVASIILTGTISSLFQFRLTTIIVGVFLLVFFIGGKYVWYIIDLITNRPPITSIDGSQIDSHFWSNLLWANVFMLSFPDLLIFLLGIALIVDKSKNFAKIIAPYGMYFGLLYLVVSSLSYNTTSYAVAINWYELIFVGDGITRMPTLTYIFLSLSSLWVLMGCKQFSRWSIFSTITFGLLIFLYSGLMQLKYNVGANALTSVAYEGLTSSTSDTGVVTMVSTPFANYFCVVKNLLNSIYSSLNIMVSEDVDPNKYFNLYFLAPSLTFGILCFVICFVTMWFKNKLTRDIRKMNFIYYPWYHQSKIFRDIGYAIDANINTFLSKITKRSYLFGLFPKDARRLKLYTNYLKEEELAKNPNIDYERIKEINKRLEEKEALELQKIKDKQKNKKSKNKTVAITTDEIIVNEIAEASNKPIEPNVVQQWYDEGSGYTWGMDPIGKYYYWYQDRWVPYQL